MTHYLACLRTRMTNTKEDDHDLSQRLNNTERFIISDQCKYWGMIFYTWEIVSEVGRGNWAKCKSKVCLAIEKCVLYWHHVDNINTLTYLYDNLYTSHQGYGLYRQAPTFFALALIKQNIKQLSMSYSWLYWPFNYIILSIFFIIVLVTITVNLSSAWHSTGIPFSRRFMSMCDNTVTTLCYSTGIRVGLISPVFQVCSAAEWD